MTNGQRRRLLYTIYCCKITCGNSSTLGNYGQNVSDICTCCTPNLSTHFNFYFNQTFRFGTMEWRSIQNRGNRYSDGNPEPNAELELFLFFIFIFLRFYRSRTKGWGSRPFRKNFGREFEMLSYYTVIAIFLTTEGTLSTKTFRSLNRFQESLSLQSRLNKGFSKMNAPVMVLSKFIEVLMILYTML